MRFSPSRSFRRWLAASPSIDHVLISWGLLGAAILTLVPIGLTLARLAHAPGRFEWPQNLLHTFEYVLLPGTWAAARVAGLVVAVGLLVHLASLLTRGRFWKSILPAFVIAALGYVSLTHFAERPGLGDFFYGPLRAIWLPADLRLVPVFFALSLTVGLLAFFYFDRCWAVSLLGLGWGRSLVAAVGATHVVVLALVLVQPSGWFRSATLNSSQPNVILISMDTLRSDHLSSYGYAKETSPHLDALARRGAIFLDAITQAPWTLPAHMTLFTALYPSEHGLFRYQSRRKGWKSLSPEVPLLAEVLQKHGYVTAAFTGGGFVGPAFGFARGFDLYRTDARRLEGFHGKVLRWLRRNRHWPFFLFLQFYNTHRPYDPPPPYDTMFLPAGGKNIVGRVKNFCWGTRRSVALPTEALLETVVSQYDGEIRFADELLGEIFLVMDELGLTEDTLIVFLSDHGEAFFEHGNCDHIKSLYNPLVRIPLILAGPGISAGVRVEQVVELRDVPQWVLDYAEVSVQLAEPRITLGQVIRGEVSDRSSLAYAETCCRGYEVRNGSWIGVPLKGQPIRSIQTDRFKLITDGAGTPLEFYDLREDPGEQSNILDSLNARDVLRRDRLTAYEALKNSSAVMTDRTVRRRREGRTPTAKDLDVDAETLEQLEALGYVE